MMVKFIHWCSLEGCNMGATWQVGLARRSVWQGHGHKRRQGEAPMALRPAPHLGRRLIEHSVLKEGHERVTAVCLK